MWTELCHAAAQMQVRPLPPTGSAIKTAGIHRNSPLKDVATPAISIRSVC
ncbi:hypothetical protein JOB18_004496 [Solea senegalensis]|uniref:Uncharacterized protein n=1 Tax=Solea senegalensis TaxID=28829 RepID=A0AAV6PPB1_SOLSE|nr:hypothetical protein JOB18_004496 [Solea senegalensis]